MTNRRRTGCVLFATARARPRDWLFDWRAGDLVFLFSIIYQHSITDIRRQISDARIRFWFIHSAVATAAKQLALLGLPQPKRLKTYNTEKRLGIYTINDRIQKL